ncbi:hypothetical protein OGH69_02820 [Flavobacterium sp. MFBS3-15]|uniref:hypothetical protein n=1 Tax=Flavobacterium sp. MFBS3-15 TaxID=2989816 RepID=UPI0022369F22|nr:hypothetical protein [Flavobacterium sp. MFBS3-15]MCW4467885.1 hypothetical protein [Flavobacterium sp. MFBS3-15]
MKYPIVLLSAALLAVFSYSPKSFGHQQSANLTTTDTLIVGDINHDRIIDTAFITDPKWINDDEGWGNPAQTPYEIDITFSCGLASIHDGNAVMGYVEDIGDIDGDKISELIVVPYGG